MTIHRPAAQRPAWLPRALALVVAGGVAVACLTQPQLVTGPAGYVSDVVTDQLSSDDPPTDPLVEKPVRDKTQKQKQRQKQSAKKNADEKTRGKAKQGGSAAR